MQQHFGRLAQRYDELRLPPETIGPQVEKMVEAGNLRGRKVLDIGCGTGRTLAALVEHYAVQGWGIDASAEMLEVARAQLPPTVSLQQATAESLPFADSFFERVYMTMVVHLLKRPLAFSEIRRVLAIGGRVTIMTPVLESFERNWLARFFPSYLKIEQNRFPGRETLEEELTQAAFTPVSCLLLDVTRTSSKETALQRLHGQPFTDILLTLDPRRFEVIQAEMGDDGGQVGFEGADRTGASTPIAHISILHDVLSLASKANHAIGDGEE